MVHGKFLNGYGCGSSPEDKPCNEEILQWGSSHCYELLGGCFLFFVFSTRLARIYGNRSDGVGVDDFPFDFRYTLLLMLIISYGNNLKMTIIIEC